MEPYDYKSADEILTRRNKKGEVLRKIDRKKVKTNTYLERGEDRIFLIYHKAAILTYFKNGSIMFDTDGWSSPTTISRMDDYQRKINLCRRKKKWWYYISFEREAQYPFYDGLIVKSNGKIIEPKIKDQVESKNFGHLMGRF